MQHFKDSAARLRSGSALTCTNIMQDTSRYQRYLDMSANKSLYFISTGFKELDMLITGIDRRNENLVIAARTGVGKSWLLLTMAAAAAKQGLTVGIYSGEMSVDKVAYRIDTLLGQIDNKKITHGDLIYKDYYKRYLEDISTRQDLGAIKVITPNDIAGPPTVDALRAFVEKENIEILFIDQYSLLEDTSKSKVMHEKVANISKAIKILQVEKQIPIISVAQMNRTKNEDKSQDSTQIGLSDRIPQDATVVIMLEKEEVQDDQGRGVFNVTINIVKSRDGGDGRKLTYRWDFNSGIYRYIPQSGDETTTEEEFDELTDRYTVESNDCPF
jgi:replicative DNA helicase